MTRLDDWRKANAKRATSLRDYSAGYEAGQAAAASHIADLIAENQDLIGSYAGANSAKLIAFMLNTMRPASPATEGDPTP